MIRIRPATERGQADHGWLQTFHTFSFAGYHDPEHMGFRTLRVLNDDTVAPGRGFDTHGHRDMEIITYVLDGAIEHRDSLGNGSVLRPGDVQCMSAGHGVTHSEFNPSATDPLRLLQIWVLPQERGLEPGYQEKRFDEQQKRDRLQLIVSPDQEAGSLRIHQDVRLYAALLAEGTSVEHRLRPGRHAWVQIATGGLTLDGQLLGEGDGAAVSEESVLRLQATRTTEVLLFDLN